MAAPKGIKSFLQYTLRLPHLWWGKKIAKEHYPNDWQRGHKEIVLTGYAEACGDDLEAMTFVADDGETYKIIEQTLKTYWREKRFKGNVYICVMLFIHLYALMHI